MKRVFIFSMCILLITTSIIINIPMGIYASDNDFTLSITSEQANNFGPSLSETEARNAVNNHGDIYGSDHKLILRYTPMSDYNWTSADGTWYAKDNQVVNYLRAKTSLNSLGAWFSIGVNHPVPRALMKSLGFLVGHDSSLVTTMVDTLTGNYNYLNDMTYSESDGLTIGKDTVDSLKKKLERQYYESIGLYAPQIAGKPTQSLNVFKSIYEDIDEFNQEVTLLNDYDYAITCRYMYANYGLTLAFNKSEDYYYPSEASPNWLLVGSSDFSIENNFFTLCHSSFRNLPDGGDVKWYWNGVSLVNGYGFTPQYYLSDDCFKNPFIQGYYYSWSNWTTSFYSKDGSRPMIFKSYQACYNYVHGSQTAYVSSKVSETGQDLKLSIDDMNTDITDKLDEVIDSINSKKEGMTADELQNAIDKGLEDLKKDTGDIKDNTTDIKEDTGNILEVLKQQNDILLQILGVTEYIAYNNGEDKNNYTIADVRSTMNNIFTALKYAVMYGVNTLDTNSSVNNTVSYTAYVDNDVGIATYSSDEQLDYKNGLFGKFPFSVPYQLYEWLQMLQAEPKTPQFCYNYGFLLGAKNEQKYDLIIDFEQYSSWALMSRSFLRISFTLALAIGVYRRFKGEL